MMTTDYKTLIISDSCDGVRCPENQKCTIRNGQPKCELLSAL